MLDLRFVRENPEVVKQNIRNKFQDAKLPLVDEVIELDEENRKVKKEADDLRANRNKISKQIGALMGQGKREEAEVVETVSGNSSCRVKVDSVESLHDLCVVRDLEIRNDRITEFLYFHVLAVIFTDRNGRIDDVRDRHHDLFDALLEVFFFLLKFSKVIGSCGNLFLYLFCFFSLSLSH